MNEKLNQMSFIDKKEFVKNACDIYRKLLIKLNIYHKKMNYLQKSHSLDKTKLEKNKSIFEWLLSYLSTEERKIIEKEFIEKDATLNATWYLDYMSKNTYYKLKHRAVDKFISLIYI